MVKTLIFIILAIAYAYPCRRIFKEDWWIAWGAYALCLVMVYMAP